MKRGIAGVRLCDVASCYQKWPCNLHGTLMRSDFPDVWVTPYTHDLNGTVYCGTTTWCASSQRDNGADFKCLTCGYTVCSCRKPDDVFAKAKALLKSQMEKLAADLDELKKLPDGWVMTPNGGAYLDDIAAVRPRKKGWEWCVNFDDCRLTGYADSREEAIAKCAQELDDGEEEDIEPGQEQHSLPLYWHPHESGGYARFAGPAAWYVKPLGDGTGVWSWYTQVGVQRVLGRTSTDVNQLLQEADRACELREAASRSVLTTGGWVTDYGTTNTTVTGAFSGGTGWVYKLCP